MPTIKCTDKQAMLIEMSLDTLSRMSSGQLDEAIRGIEYMTGRMFPIKTMKERDSYLEKLKAVLFPELDKSASYGVGMKEIGDAEIAYEMVKKLQNHRSRYDAEDTVLKHEPLHYSTEPLITVEEK